MIRVTGIAALLGLAATAAYAQDSYIAFDDAGNMQLSGPFELTIPKPRNGKPGGPHVSSPSFLDERLKISRAGYFAPDQFVVVQVETTSQGPGAMSNEFLPVMELAGKEFRAREGCVDISQEELDDDNDPLFEFIEQFNVQIVPAVMAMQLMAVNETGSAMGTVLFIRNVPGGCESMPPEFEEKFIADFERFIESVQAAN